MKNWVIPLALIIAFAFGNLYRFSLFSPEIRISALDIVVFSMTLLAWPKAIKHLNYLIISILVFFTVGLISLVFAIPVYGFTAVGVGSIYLVRWIVYSLFFASIIQLIKSKQIVYILYSIGIITAILSLAQYIIFPDIRSLTVAEWDPHYFRVVGTFLDPGFTGLILVFTLIFFTLRRNKFLWILSYIPFALTYSRSSYAAFLVSMAYIAWKVKGWKFFIGVLLLFTFTIYLLPRVPDGEGVKLERTNSIQARIDSWATAWKIFTEHPILGVGFNTYRYAQGASLKSHAGAGSDSSLLFVAATTGLVGFLAYLWYIRRLFLLRTMNYGLQATLVAVLVHSVFLNSLFYPAVMAWIALLLSASDSRPGPWLPAPKSSHRGSN